MPDESEFEPEDMSWFASNAPKFLWLIRDFRYQFDTSPKDYMENVLATGSNRAKHVFEETREVMFTVFPDRNCITLPPPLDDMRDPT
jgi:hypothetical protein